MHAAENVCCFLFRHTDMLTPVNRVVSTPVNAHLFTLLSMSTFKERLEEAAKDKGVSVAQARADLKKLLGGTRSNQTHWWTGRAKEPKGGAAAIAAGYFNVNALWLARGEGEKKLSNGGGKNGVASKYEELDQGEIEGILSMYLEMDDDARAVARRQWSDLLELTGSPSARNPWGKAKGKAKAKAKPKGSLRKRRTGNA